MDSSILIRNATITDVPSILQLEKRSWQPVLCPTEESIIAKITTYPEGQYLLMKGGEIGGVLYTQVIKSEHDLKNAKYNSITELHSLDGDIIQLITIAVDSTKVPNGANLLRNHVKEIARCSRKFSSIVAITRCSSYESEFDKLDFDMYKDYVETRKDSTIFFHTSGGAEIVAFVKDYRPEDLANYGYGILIRYPIVSIVSIEELMSKLKEIVTKTGVDFNESTPFLNFLDSLKLMEFHSFIEKLSRQKLSVDFLFRHSTAYEVSSYFLKNKMLPKSDMSSVSQPSMINEGSAIVISSIAFKLPGGVQTLSDLSQAQFKKSNMSEKSDSLFSPADLKDFPSASYGCFIHDKYKFNAEFFGISTAEATTMDPNQRLLLEVVARAIYNTGRKLDDVKNKKIGVWVAMSNSDYHLLDGKGFKGDSSTFSATSTALSMCAGRISFVLGLHGPSIVVDTACSSSLVAVHQACSSILTGECEEAIVAASNLILTPWVSLAYARAGMLSSKGKCMVFDEESNGYCRGEGVCALILVKRTINPIHGVRSYATVKACQTMHHGRGASLTAPNSDAQKDLLQTVLRKADISIEEIDFIEAHGTGTKLGDPIEVAGISSVFAKKANNDLWIGSVKANLGHLEAAAGMAGISAALGAFSTRTVPPNANLIQLNRAIVSLTADTRIKFPTESITLRSRTEGPPLRSLISSFGYSGTISSIILEEPSQADSTLLNPSLEELNQLTNGQRGTFIWQFPDQLMISLEEIELMKAAPILNVLLTHKDVLLNVTGIDLEEKLKHSSSFELEALFKNHPFQEIFQVYIQYSFAHFLIVKGVIPVLLLGCGLGEFTAAVVSGSFSLKDCLSFLLDRANILQRFVNLESMFAIQTTDEDYLRTLIACSRIEVAARYSTDLFVICGEEQQVLSLLSDNVRIKNLGRVRSSYPYHTTKLAPAVDEISRRLESMKFLPGTIPIFSAANSTISEVNSPNFWSHQMMKPVDYFISLLEIISPLSTGYVLEISLNAVLTKHFDSVNPESADWCAISFRKLIDSNLIFVDFDQDYNKNAVNYIAMDHNYHQSVDISKRYDMDLIDHCIDGEPIFAGANYLDLFYWYRRQEESISSQEKIAFEEFSIFRPVPISATAEPLYIDLVKKKDSLEFTTTALGKVAQLTITDKRITEPFEMLSPPPEMSVDISKFYDRYKSIGLEFGPSYRLIKSLMINKSSASSMSKVLNVISECTDFILSQTLDAIVQIASAVVYEVHNSESLFVPINIQEGFVQYDMLASSLTEEFSVETLACRPITDTDATFDCLLKDSASNVLVCFKGLHLRKFKRSETRSADDSMDIVYCARDSWKLPDLIMDPSLSTDFSDTSFLSINLDRTIHESFGNLKIAVADDFSGILKEQLVIFVDAIVDGCTRAKETMKSFKQSLTCLLSKYVLKKVLICCLEHTTSALSSNAERLFQPISSLILTSRLEYFTTDFKVIECSYSNINSLADHFHGTLMKASSNSAIISKFNDDEVTLNRTLEVFRAVNSTLKNGCYKLNQRGDIENLVYSNEPSDDTLEDHLLVIDVCFIGLNFRDVLNVLGMYPGDPGDPGCEFSGIVVNSNRNDFSPGDRVVGFHCGCLKERLKVSYQSVIKLPSLIPLDVGAVIPVVFSTIEYSLSNLGRITKDDCILIHSAAGGVGIAAVKYALRVGATIITTTSDEKYDYLRSLGIDKICSSRDSEKFKSALDEYLGEKRLTIVLNSLSGNFIKYSLNKLGNGGKFIELGKRDVLSQDEMSQLRPDVSYHLVELDSLALERPCDYQEIMTNVIEKIGLEYFPKSGDAFYHTYDFFTQTKTAFQSLRSGKNIGKNILRVKNPDTSYITCYGGVFVISGGTGSLGIYMAKFLLENDATTVYLLSRSATVKSDVSDLYQNLTNQHRGRLISLKCDVSNEMDCIQALNQIRQNSGRIDGVVHCAGIVRDALMQNDVENLEFANIWDSKALSARNLHNCTLHDNLRTFILFSSIVAAIGREGQSSYSIANAYLDELALQRNARHLPAISVRLPAILDVGMAAHGQVNTKDWSIKAHVLEKLFDVALDSRDPIISIFPRSIERILDSVLLKDVLGIIPDQTETPGSTQIANFAPPSIYPAIISICKELIVHRSASTISLDTNVITLGLDSLSATEFASRLSKQFSVRVPATFVFNYPVVSEMVDALTQMVSVGSDHSKPVGKANVEPSKDAAVCGVGITGLSFVLPGTVEELGSFEHILRNKLLMTGVPIESTRTIHALEHLNSSKHLVYKKDLQSTILPGGYIDLNHSKKIEKSWLDMSNLELEKMDIRQLLALKYSVKALEDAGLSLDEVKGRNIAVFAASLGQLKSSPGISSAIDLKPSVFDGTANSLSVLSGRISFLLGLQGPSLSIDTACSSSLVAIHLAKQSLERKDCDLAVVVGVNIIDLELSIPFALAGMLSPDGRCHTFDESANGYCRGEGCGAVVLKRLSEAEKDGDKIYAVIKGSAVMQDGKSASLTAPNGLAQEKLLRAALADAGLQAKDISYIEAHGTGTRLGDPIEMEAIARVYGDAKRSGGNQLFVGSCKANLGHLEAAAGMAGLIANIVFLSSRAAMPNAGLSQLNREITPFVGKGITILEEPYQMEASNGLNCAVSSFGYSGTIAHLILSSHESTGITSKVSRFQNNAIAYQNEPQPCDQRLITCFKELLSVPISFQKDYRSGNVRTEWENYLKTPPDSLQTTIRTMIRGNLWSKQYLRLLLKDHPILSEPNLEIDTFYSTISESAISIQYADRSELICFSMSSNLPHYPVIEASDLKEFNYEALLFDSIQIKMNRANLQHSVFIVSCESKESRPPTQISFFKLISEVIMCLNKEAGLGILPTSAGFCLETGEINVSQSATSWILGNYRDSAAISIIVDEITSTKVTFSFSVYQEGIELPILLGSHIVLRCCEALQANPHLSPPADKSAEHCDPLPDQDFHPLQEAKPVETHASFLPVIVKVRDLVSALFDRTIDDDDINLAELGMDSIMTTELANSLSQEFSFEFPSTRLVDYPTIRAIIEYTLEKLSVFEAIVKASDRTLGGNLLANCEWFLNYFCPNPKARLIVFGGMAHPVVSWHQFVQPFLGSDISVHIVRLPGRFERLMEPPVSDCKELVHSLCEAICSLGWLEGVPICFLGYSFGATLAYETIRTLFHDFSYSAQHFISLAGPDRAVYSRWKFLPGNERSLEAFIDYHRGNLGRMNPLFDLNIAFIPKLFSMIMEVFHRDMATAVSWKDQFDALSEAQRLIPCHVTCIYGDIDVAVEKNGWLELTKSRHEEIIFPGDHFFVYHNQALDNAVVQAMIQSIYRGLNIFG